MPKPKVDLAKALGVSPLSEYESKCYQCGTTWNPGLPPPLRCPACRSEWWGKDRRIENAVGLRNTYEIHSVASPREDIVELSLSGVGFGHAPTVYLEGMLYRRLREQARTLQVPIAALGRFTIQFNRDSVGKAELKLTAPANTPSAT